MPRRLAQRKCTGNVRGLTCECGSVCVCVCVCVCVVGGDGAT